MLTLVLTGALAAFGVFATGSWDWELLSGGLYRVAPQMETSRHRDFLRRGRLRFLDQGAGATVSVKEVAGELSLAIDGKVDATDGADMLTQRMLAHLPLLLHPAPESVFIVGHGSGVTAGSALRHDVKRVTAAEISPKWRWRPGSSRRATEHPGRTGGSRLSRWTLGIICSSAAIRSTS